LSLITPSADASRVVLPGTRDPRDATRSIARTGSGYTAEEIADLQRDRLCDAIVRVSAHEGYDAITLKMITQEAGVSLTTFYDLFPSKADLFLHAYDVGVATLFTVVADAYTRGDHVGRAERLSAGIGALLTALADNPAFAHFFLIEIPKAGEEGRQRVEEAIEAANGMFTGAEASGDQPLPDPHIVPLLVGGIFTRLTSYVHAGRTAELPDLLPSFVQFTEAGYGVAQAETINLQPPRR
jgi:AcrR family transcriptional regulator